MKTEIGKRIIELSTQYSTDKEFLQKCEITNHSLITELKKGRLKSPGAEIISQIVRGTGCSGTWLLTGKGEMFEPRQNPEGDSEAGSGLEYAFNLLQKIEHQAASLEDIEIPVDVELQLARLLVKVLERRR